MECNTHEVEQRGTNGTNRCIVCKCKNERVYKFDELETDIQERVLEKQCQWAQEQLEPDMITDMFKDYIETKYPYLPADNFRWSLSYSQGDGVHFSGSIDIEEYLKKDPYIKKIMSSLPSGYEIFDISAQIKDAIGHNIPTPTTEVFDGCVTTPQDDEGESPEDAGDIPYDSINRLSQHNLPKTWDDLLNHIQSALDELVADVAGELEAMGYEEIEYQTSEEVIKENIKASEYYFNKHGDVI